MGSTQAGPPEILHGGGGPLLSREVRHKLHQYRHHAAQGVNAAASAAMLVGGISGGNPDHVRTGAIRAFTQAAWFAKVSEKSKYLKKFQDDTFLLSVSAASIGLRAPHLYNVFQNGSAFSRTMAAFVVSAFALQVTPFIARGIKRAFHLASNLEDTLMTTVCHRGPTVFMGMNAAGAVATGYMRRDWFSAATGATYLAGIGLVYAFEKYMGDTAGQLRPQDVPDIGHHHPVDAGHDPGHIL